MQAKLNKIVNINAKVELN